MVKYKLLFFLLFLGFSQIALAQEFVVSGLVIDAETGETLPGAGVKVQELNKGVTTDFDGKYSIKLAKGTYVFEVFFLGFDTKIDTVVVNSDLNKDFTLGENVETLQEVVITGEAEDKNVTEVQMSTEELSIEEIKKLPPAFGEVDVVKSLELLPGVTTIGEGASGFNVRGGAADQNLILFNKAPIYVSSHLLGFFSVFNSVIVDDLTLYKGGIPANYGGRLSSILDVRQRWGSDEELKLAGGIGVVSVKGMIEAPIVKDKSSVIFSARRSLFGYLVQAAPDEDISSNNVNFYDLNLGLNFKIDEKNQISFSSYYGKDVFASGDDFRFEWGTFANSLQWKHTFNDSLFATTSLIYSNYSYKFGIDDAFNSNTSISNYILDYEMKHLVNPKHTLTYGANINFYDFLPPDFIPEGDFQDVFQQINLDKEYALDNAIYISDEWKISPKLTAQVGLRYNHYIALGPKTEYQYIEGQPLEIDNVIDTTYYGSGEVVANYGGFEPRLGLNISVDSVSAFKVSYSRTRQNIHLISNATGGLPLDRWKLSDNYIKPQIGDQIALGYFRNIKNNSYEFSAEVYYKKMQNQVDYKNGANLFFFDEAAEYIETQLLQGEGRAYGLELMMKKVKGKFTGWIAYTLARTERKIDGPTPSEQINRGEWYVTPYDKTHEATVVGVYQLDNRRSISSNFIFASGRAVTFPDGKYQVGNSIVTNYSSRNGNRIEAYHRLDLSYRWQTKKSLEKRWKSYWMISIYNLYGRKNPYSYIFSPNENDPNSAEVYRFSLLGTIIPAITYEFTF